MLITHPATYTDLHQRQGEYLPALFKVDRRERTKLGNDPGDELPGRASTQGRLKRTTMCFRLPLL
jgi:hypothetical protein